MFQVRKDQLSGIDTSSGIWRVFRLKLTWDGLKTNNLLIYLVTSRSVIGENDASTIDVNLFKRNISVASSVDWERRTQLWSSNLSPSGCFRNRRVPLYPQRIDQMTFNGDTASNSMIWGCVQKMVQVGCTKICQSIGVEDISHSD